MMVGNREKYPRILLHGKIFFIIEHRGLANSAVIPHPVSSYRVTQMQGIGLRSVQAVREHADNTADAMPCDRLRRRQAGPC